MNARRPHFLEVYLPNLSCDRLRVPSQFIKNLGGSTPGSVSLTGPSGHSWHVELIEHNDHLFLADGWSTFVKDHSLECGDSLVFRFDGNFHFTVQVFDQSSCEKEAAFYAKCSQGTSHCNGIVGQKRGREMEATFFSVTAEKKMRGSCTPGQLDFHLENFEGKFKTCGDEGQGMVINGCNNRTKELIKASEKPIILALPRYSNGQVMPVVRISCTKTNTSKKMKACKKRKKIGSQKKPGISKFIESRAAQYFTSSFPFFVRVMKRSNVSDRGTLKIPVSFSTSHFPNCRTKVTLRNLNGECWMLNSIPTARLHSTMHTLCGGWLGFVRGNGLKLQDVCIFELVDKCEMLVRILRLGLEERDSQTEKNNIDFCNARSSELPSNAGDKVPRDSSEAHFPKFSRQTNEPSVYDREEHRMATETVSGMQQEVESSVDANDDSTSLKTPEKSHLSTELRTHNKSTDQEHLISNATGDAPYQTRGRSPADSHIIRTLRMPLTAEEAKEALSFTSPYPNFMKVMMNSNVGGSYNLAVPRKFSAAHLPSQKSEVVLRNLRGDCWNVTCIRYGLQLKFCAGWMTFVRQNEVKLGDICIFELVDNMVFQVHIFKAGQMALECQIGGVLHDDPVTSVDSTVCTVLPQT